MSNKEEVRIKRPAFQFYPSDWRRDTALQTCSLAAQGMWINLLCVMHECEPYGHLVVNDKALTNVKAARLVGVSVKEFAKLLAEIEGAGVVSRTPDGTLFSRRMVRDEGVRNARAAGGGEGKEFGALGGEHGAKGGRPVTAKGGSKPPIEPPPSSSSSSPSSSTSVVLKKTGLPENFNPGTGADTSIALVAAGLDLDSTLMAFKAHHKAKGTQCVDWMAAWEGWVLNAKSFSRKPGSEPAKVSGVWHESAGGVDRMAVDLGIAPIDDAHFETRPAFRLRVMTAEAAARRVTA